MDKTGKASWRNQAIWLIDHATWVLSVIAMLRHLRLVNTSPSLSSTLL
jgi:hypothetical protein